MLGKSRLWLQDVVAYARTTSVRTEMGCIFGRCRRDSHAGSASAVVSNACYLSSRAHGGDAPVAWTARERASRTAFHWHVDTAGEFRQTLKFRGFRKRNIGALYTFSLLAAQILGGFFMQGRIYVAQDRMSGSDDYAGTHLRRAGQDVRERR